MASFPADDPFDFAPPAGGHDDANNPLGWDFGALDNDDRDWSDWFAGLVNADHPQPPQQQNPSRPPNSPPPTRRSPSPVPGGYLNWVTGDPSPSPSSARDALRQPHSRSAAAASASNPTTVSSHPPTQPSTNQLPQSAASNSNPRQPAPNHSNNWLDPAEARRPARVPYIPDHFAPLEPDSPSSVATPSDDSYFDVDIDELLTDPDSQSEMAPSTRRTARAPRNSIVDLTADPSSPPRPSTASRKRSRDESTPEGGASNKRPRRSSDDNTPKPEPMEELDLTNEAPSAEEELLRNQRQAAVAAQQQATTTADAPLRVGQRTCIICMEPYTNATITACGHIYCHECLTQALIAGEKNSERGVGNCPVCRKPVNRKKERQMVPVAFMKRERWRGKKGVAGRA